ncbi:MAG TPA: hypothetical protein VNB78_05420 [Sphingomicrobium sp.]|jgi:invasion protein IalB|nr:hypothetical protein [Sphingomicrobium sp.]
MKRAVFILATTFVGFASAGSASSPQAAAQPAPSAKKMLDPNEMVCEKQGVPGSRLVAARVCHTRAEWADLKGQDRQELERVQVQRGMQK